MIVLLAIFAVMGGAFWNMVGKQAQMVREEEQKEEANAISAIYIETGEFSYVFHFQSPLILTERLQASSFQLPDLRTPEFPREMLDRFSGSLSRPDTVPGKIPA